MLEETYFNLFKKHSIETRERFKESSYIYILKQKEPPIETDKTEVLNYYKMGYGKIPRNRLSSIQMCNPYEVELIFTYETLFANEVEKNTHLYFNSRRVRGEWFLVPEDVIQNFMRHDFFHTIIEQSPVLNLLKGKTVGYKKKPPSSMGTIATIFPDGFDSEHIFFTSEGVNMLDHFEFIELTNGGLGNLLNIKTSWGHRKYIFKDGSWIR